MVDDSQSKQKLHITLTFSLIPESDENCCEIYHQTDTTTAAISSFSGLEAAKMVLNIWQSASQCDVYKDKRMLSSL
jgi:hypothetical protein